MQIILILQVWIERIRLLKTKKNIHDFLFPQQTKTFFSESHILDFGQSFTLY